MTAGNLLVEQGALYPALCRLETHGLLETEWGTSENNRRAKYLAGSPIFLIFAVVSLAIGLSVTTAAYSILYALWKPVVVHEADRVVMVTTPWSAPRWILVMSSPDFDDLRGAQTSSARSPHRRPSGRASSRLRDPRPRCSRRSPMSTSGRWRWRPRSDACCSPRTRIGTSRS
jgi:hypothetical protein